MQNEPTDWEKFFKNHPLWWAGFFFSLGVTTTTAAGKFLYVNPRDQEIAQLQKQLSEEKSNPALEKLLRQTQSNRDEWVSHAKKLEEKVATYNTNSMILNEISRLSQAKKEADHWADFYLSPPMNSKAEEPSKTNILRSGEYRRQATQFQDQILGYESKISQ